MRKRIQAIILVVLLIANMLAGCANKPDSTSTTVSEPEKKEINSENDITILNGAAKTKVDGPDSALHAIEEVSEQLGIHNVSKELTFAKEDQVFENNYYTFDQKYEGIPVYGRKEVVAANSEGTVLTVAGNYVDLSKLETSPRINEKEAYDVVFEYYGENADIYCNGLVIYSLHDIKPQLSWNLTVKTEQLDEECIVSAINGEILYTNSLLSYNEGKGVGEDIDNKPESFNVVFEGGHYVMKDNERNIFMYDAGNSDLHYEFVLQDSNGNIYKIKKDNRIVDEKGKTVDFRDNGKIYDEKGNYLGEDIEWAIEAGTPSIFTKLKPIVNDKNTWDNKKAVTIYSRLEKIYNMWKSEFQCSGYDNKNGTVYAVCNDNYKGNTNAYSDSRQDGGILLLGFGTNNSLAIDTIAHEYAHGIIRNRCNIDSEGEPGAINEGLADVFGEIAEDWLKNDKFDGDCDWIHTGVRSAISPNQSPDNKQYPDTYKGDYWENTDNSNILRKVFGDNGGVHTNCTVISHVAYLMSTGINGDSRFKPLSNYQIGKLFYSTLYFLPADCSFGELRAFTECIADTMSEQGELTERQRACVTYAFFEAKIPKTAVPVGKHLRLKVIPKSGDENGYSDYTLYVKDGNNKMTFNGVDIQKDGVLFPHIGEYELQIVDNKYKNNTIPINVRVYEKGGKEEITLYTAFGVEKSSDAWEIIIDDDYEEYLENMKIPVDIYTLFHHFSDSKEVNVNDPYTFWTMLSVYATMQMDDETYPSGSRLAEKYLDDEYGQMLILSEEEVRDAVDAMMPGITEYPPFPDIKYEKPYKKDGNYYFPLLDMDAGQAARMTNIEVNDDGTATAIVEAYSHSYSDNVDYVLETYQFNLTKNDEINLDSPEPYPFCIESIKVFDIAEYLSQKSYGTYRDAIDDLEKVYGSLTLKIHEERYSQLNDSLENIAEVNGLCYLSLIDFDNDGIKELLAVVKHDNDPEYTVIVFTEEKGQVVKLFASTRMTDVSWPGDYLCLLSDMNNHKYIDRNQRADEWDYNEIYGYENDEFKLISISCMRYNFEKGDWDYYIVDEVPEEVIWYSPVGRPVSFDEYKKEANIAVGTSDIESNYICLAIPDADVESGNYYGFDFEALQDSIDKVKTELAGSDNGIVNDNDDRKQ